MRIGLITVGAIVVLTAGGSATVVDSYLSISGTADVEPAVAIHSVSTEKGNVSLVKKTSSAISESDNMDLLDTTDGSSDPIAEDVAIDRESDEREIGELDLSNVNELSLSIDGDVVDSTEVGGAG